MRKGVFTDSTLVEKLQRRVVELEAEVRKLRTLNADLSERTLELFSLFELSHSLGSGARFDNIPDQSMDFIGQLMGIDLFSLMLYDPDDGKLHVKAALGIPDDMRERCTITPPHGVAGRVFATGESLYVPDVSQDPQYVTFENINIGEGSLLSVPLLDENGKPFGVLNISKPEKNSFSDSDVALYSTLALQIAVIIQNYTNFQRLKELSLTDELTGLANRRAFFTTLEEEHRRHKRAGLPYSLLLIDIDFFKKFNDTHGHLEGDIALQELAVIFRNRCRQSDLVTRYGGEEFAVAAIRTNKVDAIKLAHFLCTAVSDFRFRLKDGRPASPLTITIGVASFPEDGETYNDVLENADRALYFGKSRGRNTVVACPVPVPAASLGKGAMGDTPGRRGTVVAET